MLTRSQSPRTATGNFGLCQHATSEFSKRPLSPGCTPAHEIIEGDQTVALQSIGGVRTPRWTLRVLYNVEGKEVVILVVGRKVGNKLIVEGEEFYGHQDHPAKPTGKDLEKTLTECAESGQTLVVELPDERLVTIQSLDPDEDDSLMDELLASNRKFQVLVAKSKAGVRKPFHPREG